jgi:Family of unknown function (DUF5719)
MIGDRRLPVMVAALAAIAAIVVVGRGEVVNPDPVFTLLPAPRTPAVAAGDRLSTSYFCAGSPSTGEGVAGEVVVANPSEGVLSGTVSVFVAGTSTPIVEPLTVGPRSSRSIALSGRVDAPYVGAMVEIAGSGGVVEQRVTTPNGSSLSPCANEASNEWYFADGSTLDGIDYDLILTNPFADTAVVDIGFVTDASTRTPNAYQGFIIPPQSVVAIDVDEAGAKDEAQLSISVKSRRGRVVAAKAQKFAGSGRGGYAMTLGSPSLGDSWTFAEGELGEGISEQLVIFNPTSEPVDVDITFLPGQTIPGFVPSETVTVDPRKAAVVDVGAIPLLIPSLPTLRHATIVRTLSTSSIVVERVLTKTVDDSLATTVVLGSRIADDRWWLPTGAPTPTEAAVVVFNTTGDDGVVTVSQVGPGGAVPIPGLDQIPIVKGGIITLDLTAAEALNVPVLISTSGVLIVVEQRYPRGTAPGRSGALAIPE